MKKAVIWCIVMVMLLSAGCGGRQIETENACGRGKDRYVGEYYDCHNEKTNLEIKRKGDGTYCIQIGIFRMFSLDDVVGKAADNGIEFTATAPGGDSLNGMITLYGDTATVTFTGGEWSTYSGISKYRYHKVSDSSGILSALPWYRRTGTGRI